MLGSSMSTSPSIGHQLVGCNNWQPHIQTSTLEDNGLNLEQARREIKDGKLTILIDQARNYDRGGEREFYLVNCALLLSRGITYARTIVDSIIKRDLEGWDYSKFPDLPYERAITMKALLNIDLKTNDPTMSYGTVERMDIPCDNGYKMFEHIFRNFVFNSNDATLIDDVLFSYPLSQDYITPTVKELARAILDSRTNNLGDRIEDINEIYPILGDALEEAGCNDSTITKHIKQPYHVCGCWLIDRILEIGTR